MHKPYATDTHADEIIASTSAANKPCPRCSTEGTIDFFDLFRGHATLHCPQCPTAWTIEIEATSSNWGDIDLRN